MPKELTGHNSDFLKVVLPACAAGRLDDIRRYVRDRRRFVEVIGPHGRTMVWEAARRGRLEVVRYLAEKHGADLRALGCYYRDTRLEVSPWLIARLNGHEETCDYLRSKKAGLDFNSACYLGDRAFVEAALKKKPGLADKAYVRVHRWNGYEVRPLQYAIVGGHREVAQVLI
ncbi:MAG: hypothetical protein AAF492_09330, partial [Verrucomicrobiota bacterium]